MYVLGDEHKLPVLALAVSGLYPTSFSPRIHSSGSAHAHLGQKLVAMALAMAMTMTMPMAPQAF